MWTPSVPSQRKGPFLTGEPLGCCPAPRCGLCDRSLLSLSPHLHTGLLFSHLFAAPPPLPFTMYTAQILNQHFQLDRQEHWLAQGTPFDGTVHPSGRPPAMGKNLEGVSHRHRRLPVSGPRGHHCLHHSLPKHLASEGRHLNVVEISLTIPKNLCGG